jgi:dihydroorotase
MGTDSAPHPQHKKENACGCAGIYHGGHAIPAYAQAFNSVKALDKLEAFASHFGPQFYGLSVNTRKMLITQSTCHVPEFMRFGKETIVPFNAGNHG